MDAVPRAGAAHGPRVVGVPVAAQSSSSGQLPGLPPLQTQGSRPASCPHSGPGPGLGFGEDPFPPAISVPPGGGLLYVNKMRSPESLEEHVVDCAALCLTWHPRCPVYTFT